MNYNARDDENDPRALREAEIDEGRNQEKNIKCWWLTRPLVSRKGQRERKGTSSRMTSNLSLLWRSPKLDQSLKLSASTTKGLVTGSGTTPSIWWKGIFDIHVIDVYLTNSRSSAWVFDTGYIAHICNSKDWLRTRWWCASEMVPKLRWSPSARYLYIYLRD